MNTQHAHEGRTVPISNHRESIPSEGRRRRNLGVLLIGAGCLLLLQQMPIWIPGLPLNIGRVEGTVVSTEHFNARNIVLDIASGDVTLSPGDGDEVVVEVTRHGFGSSQSAGRAAAERLSMPTIAKHGDTIHVTERRSPAVNLSLVGRSPYRDYHIVVPENGDIRVNTGSGIIEIESD